MLKRSGPGAKGIAHTARSDDLADRLPDISPTHTVQEPATALEEAAARIKELLGVTDDDPATQRRVVIRNAAQSGRHCAECSREFAPGEPVWRFRKITGRFMGWCYSLAPHCEQCASGDWHYRYHYFEKPRPCVGCGRLVHSTTPSWQSASLCSEDCGHKARAVRDKAARAKRRGTRDCQSCRKTFTPTRTDSRFCSVACKQRAYRQRVTDIKQASRRRHKNRNGHAERAELDDGFGIAPFLRRAPVVS
jgi:hypothetical protein